MGGPSNTYVFLKPSLTNQGAERDRLSLNLVPGNLCQIAPTARVVEKEKRFDLATKAYYFVTTLCRKIRYITLTSTQMRIMSTGK